MRTEAGPWISARLARGVSEDSGKWKADFRGEEVGVFDTKAEALKAYRKAAEEMFGDAAYLPTDEEIDEALRRSDIPPPAGGPQQPQEPPPPRGPPPRPGGEPKAASEPPRAAAAPSPPHKGKR